MAMTTKERIERMLSHREADRIPIIDNPWSTTVKRWWREGMPQNVDWREYFDVDKVQGIDVDITPCYEEKVIEETDRYYIATSDWGVTMKHFKEEDSTPEFLDFTVTTAEAWEQAKARMTVDKDRVNWGRLEKKYAKWRANGDWVTANFWFGFDVTHSWMMGTENVLIAMYEQPEMIRDMFETYLDRCIAHFEMIWDAGYKFDSIFWPDDMGYKGTTFFSIDMYREMLKPVHKRAVDWAHNHGIYAQLHSCGDIMTLVPELVEIGIDSLNPLEVKAGMDPLALKAQFGDKLTLNGGINAVLWSDKEAIIAEIERLIPALKENGGYIFSSDHSIPSSVSLENFKAIIETAKRLGSYR